MSTINAQTIIDELTAAALAAPMADEAKGIEYIRIQTSARGFVRLVNTRENLEAYADRVRKNAAAFGGGLVRKAAKPAGIKWPAASISLYKQLLEDKDPAGALAIGEDKLGMVFYVGYAAFAMVAPMPCEEIPGTVSGMRDDGVWIVYEPMSGRAVGTPSRHKKDRSRAAAIASSLRFIDSMDADTLRARIDELSTQPENHESARAAWMTAHGLDDERSQAQRIKAAQEWEDGREARDAARQARREAAQHASGSAHDSAAAEFIEQALACAEMADEMRAAADQVDQTEQADQAPEMAEEAISCGSDEASMAAGSTPGAGPARGQVVAETRGNVVYLATGLFQRKFTAPGLPDGFHDACKPAAAPMAAPADDQVPAPCIPVDFDPMVATVASVQALTLAAYLAVLDGLEDINHHTECVMLRALRAGRDDLARELARIIEDCAEWGELSEENAMLRARISVKLAAGDVAGHTAQQIRSRAAQGQDQAKGLPQEVAGCGQVEAAGVADATGRGSEGVGAVEAGESLAGGSSGQFKRKNEGAIDGSDFREISTGAGGFDSVPAGDGRGALSIRLERAEGPSESCGQPVTVASFAEADAVLLAWSETAPKSGGYDKCDFLVTWPDGSTYDGRYDLKHHSIERPSLCDDMAATAEFWSGQSCPMHMASNDYQRLIEEQSSDARRADSLATLARLAQHAGYFKRQPPVSVPDLRPYLHALKLDPVQLVGMGVVYYATHSGERKTGAVTGVTARGADLQVFLMFEDGSQHSDDHTIFSETWHGIFNQTQIRLDGRSHGAPYLAQLAAAQAMRQAQASAAKVMAERKQAQDLADTLAAYPQLQRQQPGGKLWGCTLAAANLRVLLRERFPGVKFSVKTSKFSMGDSINVSWTDGPHSDAVDEVVNLFSGGSYDSMSECYDYSRSAFTELFGSSKYVHARQEFSDEVIQAAIMLHFAGSDSLPSVQDYRQGAGAFTWGRQDYHERARFTEAIKTACAQAYTSQGKPRARARA